MFLLRDRSFTSASWSSGRKRIATVSSQIKAGFTAIDLTNAFQKRAATELALPDGVVVDYAGESEDVNKSFAEMGFALLAGIALTLAIMILEFNSLRFPIYLVCVIPLSLIGVLAGLSLSGQTLSFSSVLGVIALAGVIINHAIILLDSVIQLLRKKTGKPLRDVIVEAASVRLRPIFLTTITTVIGMIPLTTASPLWGPLAFAIMFGLMFAMILTLLLVPVLFYRWPGKDFNDKESVPPVGRKGWLILVVIGLFATLASFSANIYQNIGLRSTEAWHNMTNAGTSSFVGGIGLWLNLELILDVIIFATIMYLFYLFFKKKRSFPEVFISYVLLLILSSVVEILIPSFLTFTSDEMRNATIMLLPSYKLILANTIIFAVIWMPYMWKSARVKNTFIR